MKKRRVISQLAIWLGSFLLCSILLIADTPAQTSSEPKLSHSICTAQCVLDQIFLHSGMGDTQAQEAFYGWYESYYELTGCNQSTFRSVFEYLLDVIGEIVGSPGAATMQCWQGLLAQTHNCSKTCSEYFITDASYGANVRLKLESGAPGFLEVNLNNNDLGYLPEETPNGYSLNFDLITTLQLNDGQSLLVDSTYMPSMSYSNWITRGGLTDCINAYGADHNICALLENFVTPNQVPWTVDFMDGVLYDISGSVSDQDGVSGSFSQNGYVLLDSDGDSITIEQGDYSGFYWTKVHNKSQEFHSSQITYWIASAGSVSIKNNECDNDLCRIFGDRVDADTYVYALQGPADLRLPGTYTVWVEADVFHDKDYGNNVVSYSYTDLDVGNLHDGVDLDEDDVEDTGIPLQDLPIIDLPGPGTYVNNLPEDLPGLMYRLSLPDNIYSFYIQLIPLDNGDFMYFGRTGNIPVPDYPQIIPGTYACWNESNQEYTHGCGGFPQAAMDYYLFIPTFRNGRNFQLEVTWITQPEAQATQSFRETQQAEYEEEQTQTYSEVETNDDRETANNWDMIEPFTGLIADYGDEDYLKFTITHSGIYTFSLSDASSSSRATLLLLRAPSGGVLDRMDSDDTPPELMMDASAGEQYLFKIDSYGQLDEGGMPYQLVLTGFIPDPQESNDDRLTATEWNIEDGPIQGYFWDKTTGRADYFKFTAPSTVEGTATTFTLSNPGPELRIRLTLLKGDGAYLISSDLSAKGESVLLSYELTAGQDYVLKLTVSDLKTSTFPYTLSANYQPANEGDSDQEDQQSHAFRVQGGVYQQWWFFPVPVSNVDIYIQVAGRVPELLDTTNFWGRFNKHIDLPINAEVHIWAEKDGLAFTPEEAVFFAEPSLNRYQIRFLVAGGQLVQETPSATPGPTGTPLPPLIQTALGTALPSDVVPTSLTTAITGTPIPSPTNTTPAPTSTPSPTQQSMGSMIISGVIYRLFANSDPAGVGAAEVILSVNGEDQAVVYSMIDGSYQIEVEGLLHGDNLQMRAQAPQDEFEPIFYEWQAETGVDHWKFDFYSYWEEITPPERTDQNLIYGSVTDHDGNGVQGVYIIVRMGTSDALQRIGPTDSDGYYEGLVQLPNRIMVTVWVDGVGFLPSKIQFFHPYEPENREINFFQP